MKKTIFTVFMTIALFSCGGVQQEDSKVDSLEVVDSAAVDSSLTASDSNVAKIPVDDAGAVQK